ncbi:MAG: hypothetical protein KGM44_05955 [bacterium]|nr:hypothetical protein [bacterium]
MEAHAMGPPLGGAIVTIAAVLVTIGVAVAAARMIIAPGEANPAHPKYRVLRRDR